MFGNWDMSWMPLLLVQVRATGRWASWESARVSAFAQRPSSRCIPACAYRASHVWLAASLVSLDN